MRTGRAPSKLLFTVLLAAACGAPRPDLVRAPEQPPGALLIRNVAVLEVETGRMAAGRDVLLRSDRIAAVELAGRLQAPPGAEVVDGAGATLLPGLIDSHGHVSSSYGPIWKTALADIDHNLQAYLYCGVTTVLDPADFDSDAIGRRDRLRAGEQLGPRVYTAARPVTTTGGHPVAMVRAVAPWWIRWYLAPRVAHQVDTPEDAREAVAALAESGVDFVKVMVDKLPETAPRIAIEPLRSAVEEARARNLRTVAHIGSLEDALDAARAGAAAWVHGVYKHPIDAGDARALAAFGIPMVPTTVVFENYALVSDFDRKATRLEREIAPPELIDAFNEPPEDRERLQSTFGPMLESMRANRQAWRSNVRLLRDAGVVILAGSDMQSGVFPGAGLHRELQLLRQSGLSPAEVIRAATLDPARFLARSDAPDFGRVAVGARADLLLVNGDPTRDLGAVSDIREVILGGVRLERIPVAAGAAVGG